MRAGTITVSSISSSGSGWSKTVPRSVGTESGSDGVSERPRTGFEEGAETTSSDCGWSLSKTGRPFAQYYRDVRIPNRSALALFALLAFIPGCDRGAHPAQTGKAAPDFTVSDGQTSIHLANYRGQVVLLNFWWSQCAPCIEELPSLLQLHHDNPNLAILAVSIDEDPDQYNRLLFAIAT